MSQHPLAQRITEFQRRGAGSAMGSPPNQTQHPRGHGAPRSSNITSPPGLGNPWATGGAAKSGPPQREQGAMHPLPTKDLHQIHPKQASNRGGGVPIANDEEWPSLQSSAPQVQNSAGNRGGNTGIPISNEEKRHTPPSGQGNSAGLAPSEPVDVWKGGNIPGLKAKTEKRQVPSPPESPARPAQNTALDTQGNTGVPITRQEKRQTSPPENPSPQNSARNKDRNTPGRKDKERPEKRQAPPSESSTPSAPPAVQNAVRNNHANSGDRQSIPSSENPTCSATPVYSNARNREEDLSAPTAKQSTRHAPPSEASPHPAPPALNKDGTTSSYRSKYDKEQPPPRENPRRSTPKHSAGGGRRDNDRYQRQGYKRGERRRNPSVDLAPDGGGEVLLAHDDRTGSEDYESRERDTSRSKGGPMPGHRGQKTSTKHPIRLKGAQDVPPEPVNTELEATIQEKEEQIFELKATISRLHQREGEPPKDDNHFATGFTDIACDIEQWVLHHCQRTSNDPGFCSLTPELQVLVSEVAHEPEKHLRSGHRMRTISAVVARLLYYLVFDESSSGLVGTRETTQALQLVRSKLQGTFYQWHRWRAVTMGLLTKGDEFERGFATHVEKATEELGNTLSILAPPESANVRRTNVLREIVANASKLAIEIHKQSDLIYLAHFSPGSPYDPQCMEDVGCFYTSAELVERGATIQIQIFPAVLRRSCEWDGQPSTLPAVVMKAKVTAEPPFQDAVEGDLLDLE